MSVGLPTEIQTNMNISKVLKTAYWTGPYNMYNMYNNMYNMYNMSPIADWYSTRDQLSALLLFCYHCVQTKFLVATVNKHYSYLQL